MHGHRQQVRWLSIAGLFILLFTLAACSGDSGNAPESRELLNKAGQAISEAKSYHFVLETENPGESSGLDITKADGDVLVPDKLKAQATVLYFGAAVKTSLIAIGEEQYFVNPLTGKWVQETGIFDPRLLTNEETGLAALIKNIQDPQPAASSEVDGNACWSVDGKLDTKYIAAIVGETVEGGKTVDATVCVGKSDNKPYLIKVKGVAVTGDKADTTRTIKLSDFDKEVKIEPPKI